MMICPKRNKNAVYATLILSFSLLAGAPQTFADDANDANSPIIGRSPDSFEFAETDIGKKFYVWNAGTGTLKFTLDINGSDASYFYLNKSSGESNDVNDKKNYAVNIEVDQWPDTNLDAQIVITNDINSEDVSYISLTTITSSEPNESNTPGSNQAIGKSISRINLRGNVASKKFQIWNKGTGALNYTLSIVNDDGNCFTVTPEEGNSSGPTDKKTHTVTVDYNAVVEAAGHGGTVTGEIEIKDNSNNTSYIELTATETIATHVSRIAIEQDVNYSVEKYDFRLNVDTDSNVSSIEVTTPENQTISYPDINYPDSDVNVFHWAFQDEVNDLSGYGDGRYTIVATYDDDETAQTTINFGIPNKPGTIVWPTQEPNLINPLPDKQTVSPVRFNWGKCTDPCANGIRLILEKQDGNERIEKKYGKSTTRPAAITLDVGAWDVELGIGRRYESKNEDGIKYEVGKWGIISSNFEVMKWFGTFDEFRNRPLKIADCCGTDVTFNLTGGGKGRIEDTDCGFTNIILTGTTAKSIFSINTANSNITSVGNITADSNIRAISGGKADLAGNISISGGAGSIVLNNAAGSISIGSSHLPKIIPCNFKFNQIDGLDLTSQTPVRNLQAAEWASGSLTAPWVSTMKIKGNFGANVNLDGENSPGGMTLEKATIEGTVSSSFEGLDYGWTITGNCGTIEMAISDETALVEIYGNVNTLKAAGNKKAKLSGDISGTLVFNSAKTIEADSMSQCSILADGSADDNIPDIKNLSVRGWISGSAIITDGNVGSITAGGIQNCTDDDFSVGGTIGRLEIKGIKNEAFCYINSNITAGRIGTAIVAYPKYNNSGTDFGLTTNSIDKLTLKDSSRKTTWLDPNLSTTPIIINDFKIVLP